MSQFSPLKILTSLLIFSISANSFANEPPVVSLTKGEKAPYTGLLFPPLHAQRLRMGLLERDRYLTLNQSLERSITLLNASNEALDSTQRALLSNVKTLNEDLVSEQNSKVLWFGLGIVTTLLTGWMVSNVVK